MDENHDPTMSHGKEKKSQKDPQGKKPGKTQATTKNEMPPPQFNANNSPVKKVLSEANKIVKMGMAQELALFERDTAIQSSNETIDNLRKNIIRLQMEYEKLDQNYQNEILCRAEIVKRMEATRNIVQSAADCSNKLARSVKQLDDDRLRIADFYETIYQAQKEIEDKHTKIEKTVKDINTLMNHKIEEIKIDYHKARLQNTDSQAKLSAELSRANDRLQQSVKERENLENQMKSLSDDLKAMSEDLEKRNEIIHREQSLIDRLRAGVKHLKIKSAKYQRLWKMKKKQIVAFKYKNNEAVNKLMNIDKSYSNLLYSNKVLEREKTELKAKIEEQERIFLDKENIWKSEKDELVTDITGREREKEELTLANVQLKDRISELERKEVQFLKKDEDNTVNLSRLEETYNRVLRENQDLKGSYNELNRENQRKDEMITDFQSKLNIYDSDLNSEKMLRVKELQVKDELLKQLEDQLAAANEKLTSERADFVKTATEYEDKLKKCDGAANERITLLEKQLEEKEKVIFAINLDREHKMSVAEDLKQEVEHLKRNLEDKDREIIKLNEHLQKLQKLNDEMSEGLKTERNNNERLNGELSANKCQLLDTSKKLESELSSIEYVKAEKSQLEKVVNALRKDIEHEKQTVQQLKQLNKKLDGKLMEMTKVTEENSTLRVTGTNLKSRLDESEARVEAYKVIIKKMESETVELKETHSRDLSKLKLEISRLQETIKKDFQKGLQTPRTSSQDQVKSDSPGLKAMKDTIFQLTPIEKADGKESEVSNADGVQFQGSTTPSRGNRKFLSTPRKVLTSTPRPRLRSLTPMTKKRDPYEFDSDGSVERFDPDQVLRVFNAPKKTESSSSSSKRPRTKDN